MTDIAATIGSDAHGLLADASSRVETATATLKTEVTAVQDTAKGVEAYLNNLSTHLFTVRASIGKAALVLEDDVVAARRRIFAAEQSPLGQAEGLLRRRLALRREPFFRSRTPGLGIVSRFFVFLDGFGFSTAFRVSLTYV